MSKVSVISKNLRHWEKIMILQSFERWWVVNSTGRAKIKGLIISPKLGRMSLRRIEESS